VYDLKGGYRWYKTVESFLNNELTSKNRGRWFYAHAGGMADMLFILQYLVDKPQYTIEASFSSSSAIIVHVKRGKNVWHFVDSLWLLKGSLAQIAEIIGMEKGEVDFDNATVAELIPYNEQDCKILWHAISMFENTMLNLGGQLQMTLASTAMWLFRRQHLKESILTSDWLNTRAKESYVASRVEPYRRECKNGFYFDINSSFPYAMTFPAPGNLIRTSNRLDDERLGDPEFLFITHVEIEVMEDYLQLSLQ